MLEVVTIVCACFKRISHCVLPEVLDFHNLTLWKDCVCLVGCSILMCTQSHSLCVCMCGCVWCTCMGVCGVGVCGVGVCGVGVRGVHVWVCVEGGCWCKPSTFLCYKNVTRLRQKIPPPS